ncbi:MAG: DUF4907 domain-containing protein [Prolixibacteraceae bacterium]|nr:DUF4907 domain-containing protein [Prolixibacteraceae bacterium]
MMNTIKKTVLGICFFSAILILIISFRNKPDNIIESEKTENKLLLKVFSTGEGWGYNVLLNETIIIRQDIIPVIQMNKAFQSENDARKTGELVISKLRNSKKPIIKKAELDSMNIKY